MQLTQKIKSILLGTSFLILGGFFLYAKTNQAENIIIPKDEPRSEEILNRVIETNKNNIDSEIQELNNLRRLEEYTEYKRKYILARLFEKKKEKEIAKRIYESILEKNYPLKERVLFHLGTIHTTSNDDKKAIEYFNELLNKFPNSKSKPQGKYFLAQAQLRLRLTEDAIVTLESIKKEFPDTQYGIASNYYLGEYEYNHGNYNRALALWRIYLKKSPDGRFSKEITDNLTSKEVFKLTESDYTLLGDASYYQKDYEHSIKYYLKGNDKKTFYNLGYSLFRTNQHTKAEKYFKEYAYSFPRSKEVKYALLYASKCTPTILRKNFWKTATKDLPELAYYTTYKEGLCEINPFERKKIFEKLIINYPKEDFTPDAVWELMWDDIKTQNYSKALLLGEKYFNENIDSKLKYNEAYLKIGFWVGKIYEFQKRKFNAINHYKKIQDINSDNYYAYRSRHRLLDLTEGTDPKWAQQNSYLNSRNIIWHIPMILNIKTIEKIFGITVAELIKLGQYDEAIEIIGIKEYSDEEVTTWLKALNLEYDISVNKAVNLINENKHEFNNPIWKLAYPLYYWDSILSASSKYKNLDPFLVCGVIRQESRFDRNATSISNAFGLMQLIMPTAKTVASQTETSLESSNSLKDANINIILGSHYLNGLLNTFSSPVFAVASYNAGPNAVKNWINKYGTNDLDLFIEQVPYEETRGYIKKVFSSYWTYLKLYKT